MKNIVLEWELPEENPWYRLTVSFDERTGQEIRRIYHRLSDDSVFLPEWDGRLSINVKEYQKQNGNNGMSVLWKSE